MPVWTYKYRSLGWGSIVCWRTICAALMLLAPPLSSRADKNESGVTIDDLVERTFLDAWTVSPDGRYVAFLAVKPVPLENVYQITLYLQKTIEPVHRIRIAQYLLVPQEVRDADTHKLYKAVSQFVWSPDSRLLLYTIHRKPGMELRVRNIVTGRQIILLSGHERVELEKATADQDRWQIKTFDTGKKGNETTDLPKDMALLIKDGYRFYGPLDNPKQGRPLVTRTWEYKWGDTRSKELLNNRTSQYLGYPVEYSWNGSFKILERTPWPDHAPQAMSTDPRGKPGTSRVRLDTRIEPEKTIVREMEGKDVRTVYEENAFLDHPSLSEDGKFAVMMRKTNLIPDELVRLDLTTGKMVALFSPNESFRIKTEGISVRFLPITVGEGKFSGRLFLPADNEESKRYPLVFTTYVSNPGFDLSDEVPILPLVAHGIAVFALDAMKTAALISNQGDFNYELRRVEEPREAMDWVVKKLASEGVVDAERIGVSGISYGAEISMYAYWKSDIFRTVSATTGSWEPSWYAMGGLGFEGFLKSRGFPEPRDGTYSEWKRLSAGLNARPTLPPLLWQSPDHEQSSCVESWLELRRAGAQVEWLEYPEEGHVKRNPANIWWARQRNLDWFRFWLKDEEDPAPAKAAEYSRWREMRKNWEAAKAATRLIN